MCDIHGTVQPSSVIRHPFLLFHQYGPLFTIYQIGQPRSKHVAHYRQFIVNVIFSSIVGVYMFNFQHHQVPGTNTVVTTYHVLRRLIIEDVPRFFWKWRPRGGCIEYITFQWT
ncbi:hypothetical protein SCLCIDRAFT_879068 [Scleroderma citrinum Foug A]|uniref:Uncharacterized protein n=1 Tax=Scleroderma citrinum Foug A TaxID=1036808 RepID=A0A0C3D2J9_9AGAM|nr:hypothetical protein SCLCIDRAFT_879068 [Scleroderma citrinum Foug A]